MTVDFILFYPAAPTADHRAPDYPAGAARRHAPALAARLAAEPRLASIPFVVLSALPVSGSREMPPGARARLTKPLALDHLLATVDQNCAMSEAAS
ncbi:MAG: hypothetical protein ABIP01_01640 [Candidatus Limnocylindria bacterium]